MKDDDANEYTATHSRLHSHQTLLFPYRFAAQSLHSQCSSTLNTWTLLALQPVIVSRRTCSAHWRHTLRERHPTASHWTEASFCGWFLHLATVFIADFRFCCAGWDTEEAVLISGCFSSALVLAGQAVLDHWCQRPVATRSLPRYMKPASLRYSSNFARRLSGANSHSFDVDSLETEYEINRVL